MERFLHPDLETTPREAAYVAVVRFRENATPSSISDIEMLLCKVNFDHINIQNEDQLTLSFIALRNHFDGVLWTIPGGGKQEQDATIQETAQRETLEEVRLTIVNPTLLAEGTMQQQLQTNTAQHTYLYLATPDNTFGEAEPGEEMQEIQWVNLDTIANIRNIDVHLAFYLVIRYFSQQLEQPIPQVLYTILGFDPEEYLSKNK